MIEYSQRYDNILSFGDLNESENGREKSNQCICDVGFINVFQYRIRHELPPTTVLGSEVIDHAWLTAQFIHVIKNAGYIPFGNGISDCHRAIFLDLYIDYIKKIETRDFIPRNLISTHHTKAKKFIKIILEQPQKLGILVKLKQLKDKVDKDIKNSHTTEYARDLELIEKIFISLCFSAK